MNIETHTTIAACIPVPPEEIVPGNVEGRVSESRVQPRLRDRKNVDVG